MCDILNVLTCRRSVRKYRKDPVPEELLEKILEAGLYAPTGMNRQQTIILKITDPDTVRSLGLINGRLMGSEGMDAFYGAPAVLAVLSPKDDPTAVEDGCSVIANTLNEAASLGLGSCWVSYFDFEKVHDAFELPASERLLFMLPFGYAAEGQGPNPRHTDRNAMDIFAKRL